VEISGNAPDPSLLSTGRFYLVSLISNAATGNHMFTIKDQQILFQTQQIYNNLFHHIAYCRKHAAFDLHSVLLVHPDTYRNRQDVMGAIALTIAFNPCETWRPLRPRV
jgi:hypothetical protein